MANSSADSPLPARRGVVAVFGVFAAAIFASGAGVAWLAVHNALAPMSCAILLSIINLAVGLVALAWMTWGTEHLQRSLRVSEASLQSQITARARELESANANLRVATKVNSLLALCAQHMPNAVIITDADGMILWVNAAWEKLSGWSHARSVRHPLEEVLPQLWDGFGPDRVRRLLQSGEAAEIEAHGHGPGGHARWFAADFQPVRNELRKVVNTIVLIDDRTLQHEADLRLQSVNDRLQFALSSSGYGIWETNLVTGRIDWDDRMFELYGVSPRQFGHSITEWFGLIHPDDVQHVNRHRDQVVDGTLKTFEIDFRIVRPDGAVRLIEARGFLHRDEHGEPDRFVGLNRDVTAERQMRETLRLAEERLELALLATNESVWDWNPRTRQIYRDRRWVELVGERGGETTEPDDRWQSRVHAEDLSGVLAALDAHVHGRSPVYEAEYRLRTSGGRWIWTLDRGKVVSRAKDGKALRMVGTLGDVTDRKQLEARLRHSEEIAIQVSRLAQIGAWEYDIAASALRWEPELFRVSEVELGYQPTLAGMAQLFPDEHGEIFAQAIDLAAREGLPFDLECPFVTAQGRRRWVRLFGRTETHESRPVRVFGAVQEVTARHDAEEAQRKLEGQLFQLQRMETLGTLAGGIAHDFNNLLTGIIGYQDLAIDQLAQDDPVRQSLAEARKACSRACELVEQILVFSRQTVGSERASLDLSFLVEDARRFLRATVPATVRIEVSAAPDTPRVEADPSQLNQVLLNLGSNAAHAMRTGNGVLGIHLAPVEMNTTQAASHGNLPAGRYVRLTVSDSGTGMSSEVQKRIFDPFFTTKGVGEGTGLGLAIVHGIVRSHGGAIEVESAPGRGTRFHVYFPAATADAAPTEAPPEPPPRGEGEVICVVDDEQLVAQATRLTLERFGYKTVVFNSPDACLKALRQAPDGCALLLSDQTMPSLTGMELSMQVREFAPKLPIVIMSGYFSKVSAGALEQIGNISLLAKPFTAADLARTVRSALVDEKKRQNAAAT